MKAIILTFDQQLGFTELLVNKYRELWPDCPFVFRIPYNDEKNIGNFLKNQTNIELVKSPSDIKSTMNILLSDISDAEWIYWCIDDRYPTYIDTKIIRSVYDFTQSPISNTFNSVKLIHWKERRQQSKKAVTIGDQLFYHQAWKGKNNFWGFWHHRFIKASGLKSVFLENDLSEKYIIKDIQIYNDRENLPFQENILYPYNKSIIELAEPCVNGKITFNGYYTLKKYSCRIPKYLIVNKKKRFIKDDTKSVKNVIFNPGLVFIYIRNLYILLLRTVKLISVRLGLFH